MKILGVFFILLATSSSIQLERPITRQPEHQDQISSLLNQLIHTEVNNGTEVLIHGPSLETQEYVRKRLFQIAAESPERRSQVIQAMIKILNDPTTAEEFIVAHRWTEAVYVLGELRAVESIDILVRNLNKTGENGIISSIHYRPVLRALAKIGEPAIPRLIEALSAEDQEIRHEAARTLSRIGRPAVTALAEALHSGSVEVKTEASLALAWIGGKKARAAIEHAIEVETDQEALNRLRDALREVERVWGK